MASSEERFLNSEVVNENFFCQIAEVALNITKDKFKLRLVLLSPAVAASDNFVSVLYRAKIKVEIFQSKIVQSVDVIIKVLLTSIKEIAEFAVFPREKLMYQSVLPGFEANFREIAGENINFGPRSFLFKENPYEIIVLEDLKVRNFKMMNRKAGLTECQTKAVLSKLAYMHAASAVTYQKFGIINKYFDRNASLPPLADDNPLITGFTRMFETFVEAVKSYGDCKVFADKIALWDEKKLIKSWWVDVAVPMRCGFLALNHGDFWLNNMMFTEDTNGNPLEVSLIDFQANYWGNPINDVIYFLVSSVANDIMTTRFDDFIAFYQEKLSEALNKLKFDRHIPTLIEMRREILERASFVAACLFLILFVKNDSKEEFNLEKAMGSEDKKMMQGIYNDGNYKTALKLWLPFLNKQGILDAVERKELIEPKKKAMSIMKFKRN